ncbi:17767_t:CDS:2, partial [Cetraspora pellucida]
FALTNKSFVLVAKAFQKIYDNTNCPLIWPNVLIIDKGTEFLAIAKHDYQKFEKHAYFQQDAEDFHLPLTNKSRS